MLRQQARFVSTYPATVSAGAARHRHHDTRPGSMSNTMPATRATGGQTYLYFALPQKERVVHLCGLPSSTRSIVVADRRP